MTNIQKANLADITEIQRIAHLTWHPTFSEILSSEQIAYMLEKMYSQEALEKQMQENQVFLLLSANSENQAYASYQLHHPLENSCKIHKLYVLPHNQGKGYGAKLLEHIAQIAKEAGCSKLCLNVNRFNKALTFYQKLGFEIEKEENIDIGKGFWMEDYVMSKGI